MFTLHFFCRKCNFLSNSLQFRNLCWKNEFPLWLAWTFLCLTFDATQQLRVALLSCALLQKNTWVWTKSRYVFFYSVPHGYMAQTNLNLIPGRRRWEVAVIPAVEMCRLLMGLSIETPFPQKTLARLTLLVWLLTLQTAGCLTLTYQSHYSSSANTPQHKGFYTNAHTGSEVHFSLLTCK